jgi:RecB family exonuclease
LSYSQQIASFTWSYSRIKTFEDCPYKFFLKYLRFPGHKGKDLFFANYGSFIHELLRAFNTGEKTAAQIQTEYLIDFSNQVKAPPPNEKVFKTYFLDGLNYLKTIRPPENEVLSVEEKADFAIEGVPFVGYIDLVERDKSGLILVADYKSKTLKPHSKKSKSTKSDAELDIYLRQLYLYARYISEKYGQYPSALRLNCFRNGLVIDTPFNEVAYDDTVNWAIAMTKTIAKETEFSPSIEWFPCKYVCEMQGHCDYWEIYQRK